MSDIKVLDCTLRDGGYINSWNFGNNAIHGIIKNLEEAKIDIIECGFIRNVTESNDSTVFASMQQVERKRKIASTLTFLGGCFAATNI